MPSTQLIARLAPALVLGLILGCVSTPAPAPTPDIPLPRQDTVSTSPQQPAILSPSSFIYRDGTYAYDLHQTTIVTVGTDSTRMEDTLVTAGSLTYAIQGSNDTLVIIGIIDSLSVTSTRDTSALPRRLATPVTIQLWPVIDSTTLPPIDSTAIPVTCDSMEDAARAIARDIHIRVPAGVQRGQRWTDSTSTTVCRGGIPMIAVTVSTFEVQDVRSRGDSTIVQVNRRSTLVLSGAGTQGSRRIAVAGDGISETLFSYDLRAGAFLESRGQSELRLRFETIQQTEQVTQHSSSQVRLRPRVP